MKKYPSPKRIQLDLSRKHCEYVAERAAEYGSASKYLRVLIRDDARRQAERRLEELLREGLESGRTRRGGPQFFERMRRKIDELEQVRKKRSSRS